MDKKVGFIGLGVMGLPMAKNAARGGFSLYAYDIDPARTARLIGAVPTTRAASSVAELAECCDVVITVLPDAAAVAAVMDGANGALAHMRAGSIWMDMTTSDPVLTERLAERAASRGIRTVDAPVGRSPRHAERGELLAIVGGEEETLGELEPLLRTMASDVIRCGGVCTAHTMKLINNLLSGVIQQANIEALTLGIRAGIQVDTMLQIFQQVCVWNGYLAGLPTEEADAPGWKVSTAEEHMGYVENLACRLQVPVPAASAARGYMRELMANGHADGKYSCISTLLQMESGMDITGMTAIHH